MGGFFNKPLHRGINNLFNHRLSKDHTLDSRVARSHSLISFIEPKQDLSLAKYPELRQAVLAFLRSLKTIAHSSLNFPFQNNVDISLLLCGVDIGVRLELDDARGDAQVDEGLRFHVEELDEEGNALDDFGDLDTLEGHAFGVGLGEHFAQLRGLGFHLHPALFYFYYFCILI